MSTLTASIAALASLGKGCCAVFNEMNMYAATSSAMIMIGHWHSRSSHIDGGLAWLGGHDAWTWTCMSFITIGIASLRPTTGIFKLKYTSTRTHLATCCMVFHLANQLYSINVWVHVTRLRRMLELATAGNVTITSIAAGIPIGGYVPVCKHCHQHFVVVFLEDKWILVVDDGGRAISCCSLRHANVWMSIEKRVNFTPQFLLCWSRRAKLGRIESKQVQLSRGNQMSNIELKLQVLKADRADRTEKEKESA